MGRHAQPRELAALKGADRKNPQRYKSTPPKSAMPLGLPPAHLTKDAQGCWVELSAYALPGVLTGADRVMLEMASVLLAEFRSNTLDFSGAKIGHLVGLLARFGMSPTDRQKLGASSEVPSNPFDQLDS